MAEEQEVGGRFKMPVDDDIDDSVIPATVDELRIEKLNTRVTIISILIPVLIVIVLVIAYLDIKKRVVQTEDTGTIGVQKLSTDLESRFSSLSIRQAELEAGMTKLGESIDQASARIEVKLKKMEDAVGELKTAAANAVKKPELKTATDGLEKKLDNVAGGVEEVRAQIAAFPQDIQSDLSQLRAGVTAAQNEMTSLRSGVSTAQNELTAINEKLTRIDRQKIEKPALDLALRLETMKVEQALKDQIEALRTRLAAIEKRASQSSPPPAARANPTTSGAPSLTRPAPAGAVPTEETAPIEEQPLPK